MKFVSKLLLFAVSSAIKNDIYSESFSFLQQIPGTQNTLGLMEGYAMLVGKFFKPFALPSTCCFIMVFFIDHILTYHLRDLSPQFLSIK